MAAMAAPACAASHATPCSGSCRSGSNSMASLLRSGRRQAYTVRRRLTYHGHAGRGYPCRRPRRPPAMRLDHLRHRLRALGAKPCHERLVLRAWTRALPLDSGPRAAADFLPGRLRAALPALGGRSSARLARLRSTHAADDGSARLLVELADGRTVESVLLPQDGLCVSTQVGCAVGCTFCMTGRDGLERHLGSAEIVAAGGARAHAASGPEGRVHGHGRAGPQPGQRPRRDRPARRRGRPRAQEPGRLDRRRPAPAAAAAARAGQAGAGALAALDLRRQARAPAAERAADRSRRAGRGGRALRARDALPDPVPVDAARRRQRRRRGAGRHRAPARRQVRGDEPHSLERGAGAGAAPPVAPSARRRWRAASTRAAC